MSARADAVQIVTVTLGWREPDGQVIEFNTGDGVVAGDGAGAGDGTDARAGADAGEAAPPGPVAVPASAVSAALPDAPGVSSQRGLGAGEPGGIDLLA